MTTVDTNGSTQLAESLRQLLGTDNVLTSEAERHLYGADFSDQEFPLPVAVARPGSVDDMVATVRLATRHGMSMVARGGGMSYTRAHVPAQPDTLVLDMTRFKQIDVRLADRYVVVGVGVTWAELADALEGTGFWVAMLGTLSGSRATIGGAVSQQACGPGIGFITDQVLGIEAVTGAGRVVRTGSWATAQAGPFNRYVGPDLTGLFMCDSGALGFKTRVALRLDPVPQSAYSCFGFADADSLVTAIVAANRAGVQANIFGWDIAMSRQLASAPAPPREQVQAIAKRVLRTTDSRWRAVRQLLRARSTGMAFLTRWPYVLTVTADAGDAAGADRLAARVARICRGLGGRRLPSAVALGMRHAPFQPIGQLMFGAEGELNLPANALVPLSRAQELVRIYQRVLADAEDLTTAHGLVHGCNYLAAGHFFGLEPLVMWRERPSEYRRHFADPSQLALLRDQPADSAAREAVMEIRRRLFDAVRPVGAVHLQYGKVYPYRESFDDSGTWELMQQIKQILDPQHLINPGALGFSAPA